MTNQVHIEDLLSSTKKENVEKISETIFKVGSEIIEVVDINYDMKTIKFRYNHNTYVVEYKNNLDRTLDKMGIKRSFDSVDTSVKAPMPGKVLEVLVNSGDQVKKGDPLLILEAMKMENVLKSDADCTIKDVNVNALENVEKNQLLIELDV